ncbi:MAG: SPOR domain-containing protein [Sulfuricellaceae bacterium]|jgi:cell division septation protein DedD
MFADNSAKGQENSDQQEFPYHHPGQGSLFPEDPYLQRQEEGLRPIHYLMGAVLVAAMLGVLGVGYYYQSSMKKLTSPAEAPAPATSSAPSPEPPAAPSSTPEKAAPPPAAAAPAAVAAAPDKKTDKLSPATPEKMAAKPAPPPAETVYFLQLAAFKDPGETAQLCRKVEAFGFRCYFGNVKTADGLYWRLRLGPYAARNEAEADLAKLKGKGFDGRLIPLRKSVVKPPLQLPAK